MDINWPPKTNKDSIIGKKFGKRTAIEYVDKQKNGERYLFKCECGDEKILLLNRLRRGIGTQCFRCMRKDVRNAFLARKKEFFELGRTDGKMLAKIKKVGDKDE